MTASVDAGAYEGVLAEQLAALRRVAGLVAGGAAASDVYATIAREVGHLTGLPVVALWRYEPDATATVIGAWSRRPHPFGAGTRWPLDGPTICAEILAAERPARIDDFADLPGTIAAAARAAGICSCAGAPIVVDGAVWGALSIGSTTRAPLPDDVEHHLAALTELLGTAISSVQARWDLAVSRTRLAAAADDARLRLLRDLHDGAQQRLVHLVCTVKLARQAVEDRRAALELLAEALDEAQRASVELRELIRGTLPPALTAGGLRTGVGALVALMPLPVDNRVSVGRLPTTIEAAAYFVVAEALTNVAKHSGARRAVVTARVQHGMLRAQVRDDGLGGARPEGSGLTGLADRLARLDGRLHIVSPAGSGTLVAADIPLA